MDAPHKRAKTSHAAPTPFRTVYAFDDPCNPLELDLRVFESNAPHSTFYKTLKCPKSAFYDAQRGVFWRSRMTRATLCTLYRFITTGTLALSKHASLSEVLVALDYENLTVLPRHQLRLDQYAGGREPPEGIGFQTSDPVADRVDALAAKVAASLMRWSKLHRTLEAGFAWHGSAQKYTATTTSCWIRFAPPSPTTSYPKSCNYRSTKDEIVDFLQARTHVVDHCLKYIGYEAYKLSQDETAPVPMTQWDEDSYAKLQLAITEHPLGEAFFSVEYDATALPQATNLAIQKYGMAILEHGMLTESSLAQHFERERAEAGSSTKPLFSDERLLAKKAKVRYARGVVGLVAAILNRAPDLSVVFSGACGDEQGKTFERERLARTLKGYGVSIVRWDGSPSKPLVFPPMFCDSTGGQASTMLIDTSKMHTYKSGP